MKVNDCHENSCMSRTEYKHLDVEQVCHMGGQNDLSYW